MKEPKNILVTGGAGFIGSNLVGGLLADERVGRVRVLDNLMTGNAQNLAAYQSNPRFEFLKGDIRNINDCEKACEGMELVAHQAALGSVPRSIDLPQLTNEINITGTLNVFTAAKDAGIKRVVFAASSSTYGDSTDLPKQEDKIGNPMSPYAVTKLVNEIYARVFATTYQSFEFIGLRYFNVFGPNQDPSGAYAAVIPLFAKALIQNKAPTINGDGSYSRDFTYVDNVVQANIRALFTEDQAALNQIYNIACGERITILELFEALREQSDSALEPRFGPARIGDVPHSLADISKAQSLLGYEPAITVREGIKRAYDWYLKVFSDAPDVG